MAKRKAITLARGGSDRRHDDVIDVLERLVSECGSAANAAAVCIRESERFQRAQEQMRAEQSQATA